jgi:hypothetical protein
MLLQDFIRPEYQKTRVTRLGEFLPIGRVFDLGSFLNQEVAQTLGYSISMAQVMLEFLQKWVELLHTYMLGYIFTNSSGHPARNIVE